MDKTEGEKSKKKSIAVYSITGCAGCQLTILFSKALDLLQRFDVKAFPFIMENKNVKTTSEGIVNVDIALVEGVVANKQDLEVLKQIRKNCKTLIALGSCACTGCIPAYRQFTIPDQYKHLFFNKKEKLRELDPEPLSFYVRVDFEIPGCPPSVEEVCSLLKALLNGCEFRIPDKPVCMDCKARGFNCLLLQGKPCLGPLTRGGCGAICISKGVECWGCRGFRKDANIKAFVKLLQSKGFSKEFIKHRLETFAGLKLPMLEVFFNE
ncbi:hypothetical protein J7L02_00570 [Candidatus Woesearchaeota archaeon]|nr:hypothetical protein [Candidatus Woesearchaeota archaeon]